VQKEQLVLLFVCDNMDGDPNNTYTLITTAAIVGVWYRFSFGDSSFRGGEFVVWVMQFGRSWYGGPPFGCIIIWVSAIWQVVVWVLHCSASLFIVSGVIVMLGWLAIFQVNIT
jgi:hypothetical protein